MIFIGIGANLSSSRFGSPRRVCEEALKEIEKQGIEIKGMSGWYRSQPVPVSDQPWYINGVCAVETALSPQDLLARLHAIEEKFGRVRKIRNEARIIDLDLLAYDNEVSKEGESLVLPHPRMHERAFVMLPLVEIAPAWRHPVSGLSGQELIGALPPGQVTELDE